MFTTLIHKLTEQTVVLFDDAVAGFKAEIADVEHWLTEDEYAASLSSAGAQDAPAAPGEPVVVAPAEPAAPADPAAAV